MKLRPFELGLVVVFGGLAVFALVLLSNYSPSPKESDGPVIVGQVSVWGTLPQEEINDIIAELSKDNDSFANVSYKYYRPDEFDIELLEALADGVGPDLMLVSHEKLVKMRNRIQSVSYESFPIRDIRNQYLDGAQIFALDDGLYGYPIAVDPLVLYWNRDIFSQEGLLSPPATWEELVNSSFPKLIKRDFDRTIKQSVVAMGYYQNVRNAFGIISTLLIQGGTQGVVVDSNGVYQVRLNYVEQGTGNPFMTAVDFYTRFGKPSNALYSWNRSYEDDRHEFISGKLAMYFGYASEASQLERLNPNLNFDIAEVPQGAQASVRRTYGKFYALSILKSSPNKKGAISVLQTFAGSDIATMIATDYGMVPAHRSVVAEGSNDTYGRIAYKSASVSLGWLNPDLAVSNQVLNEMVQNINENRSAPSTAVLEAETKLSQEY